MEADRELRRLASRQHALAGWGQARALGLTRDALRHRVARGEWDLVTKRVLGLAGAPPDELRRVMAAVLDDGPGAVVGRRTAAALWQVPGFPGDGRIQITRLRGTNGRPTDLADVSTVRYLPESLVTTVAGIPTVTLPYLLFQLAGSEREDRVERALNTICTRSPAVLVRLHQLLPELAEHGRNGVVFMRDWLRRNPAGSRPVASGLEGRFQQILREAGERPLDRQVDIGGHDWIGRSDFLDRELWIVFEVDSLLHHTSELDQALDAERDARMLAAGFRAVIRIPEEWIWYDRDRAVDRVRQVRREISQQLRRSGT